MSAMSVSSGPLLVPMHVDAMTVGAADASASGWSRGTPEYAFLNTAKPIGPPPFGGGDYPPQGIHLHWTLPRPLRAGVQGGDGIATFPLVPNRWLVVRLQAGATAAKAWLVQSDYLSSPEAKEPGTSPFIWPKTGDTANIGAHFDFETLTALPASTESPFLTAIGAGSPTFALFEPEVVDVFAFTDPVTDSVFDDTLSAPYCFTYYVAGWYSDASIDPLSTVKWSVATDGQATDDTFGFVVDLAGATAPTQMLVHAQVADVSWDPDGGPTAPGGLPSAESVTVALGNTSVDALAAIVRANSGTDGAVNAELLEAFAYNLLQRLDQPAGAELLDLAITEHWFGASSGGTLWTVVASEGVAELDAQAEQALAQLNAAQRQLDVQSRVLDSMRWVLNGLSWKANAVTHRVPGLPTEKLYPPWLEQQLSSQVTNSADGWYLNAVTSQAAKVASCSTALADATTAVLGQLHGGLQPKAVAMPSYRSANDPVFVATGLGKATNLDPVENTVCRLTSQTVAELTISGSTYGPGSSCGVTVTPPAFGGTQSLLPAGIAELNTESFLLSPSLLATTVGGTLTAAEVATAIGDPSALVAGAVAPSTGSAVEWEQPWCPLFLDWQVAVLNKPAYAEHAPGGIAEPVYAFRSDLWSFDGTDYAWSGTTASVDFDEGGAQELSGRTFLTPQLSFTLAAQLDQLVQQSGADATELESLQTYIDGISSGDILSQRLSGLLALLAQRDYTPTAPPSGDVATLLAGTPQRGHPAPNTVDTMTHGGKPQPTADFFPVCGTFFVIQNLSVVDFMGRSINLTGANNSGYAGTGSAEDYFYPLASPALQSPTLLAPQSQESTSPSERMLQLPPRFVQDSRLALTLISNDGKNADVDLVAGANPVCAWVVPNFLDRSLAFYGAGGTAWGELYLSTQAGGTYVTVWQGDPTNPDAPSSVAEIENLYARTLLQTLEARTDDGTGFSDFLQTIDETLWTIDPAGAGEAADLGVLVGRPLALVRAELMLGLRGLAYTSQDWRTTFDVYGDSLPPAQNPARLRDVSGGVFDLRWPIRLGDPALRSDGLIGYYADAPGDLGAGFSAFEAVQAPTGLAGGYVQQRDAANSIGLRAIDDSIEKPDERQHQVQRLTLLLDPRALVHAFSGILPATTLQLPSRFSVAPLKSLSYVFRAGPFLSAPDELRMPRPAARRGTWSWYDRTSGASPIALADDKVRISTTPPIVRQGWLKFTPTSGTRSPSPARRDQS